MAPDTINQPVTKGTIDPIVQDALSSINYLPFIPSSAGSHKAGFPIGPDGNPVNTPYDVPIINIEFISTPLNPPYPFPFARGNVHGLYASLFRHFEKTLADVVVAYPHASSRNPEVMLPASDLVIYRRENHVPLAILREI
ncbi:MAG TPA: hypothetical protein VJB12_04505 [Candidatus Nanoarchaeia archaeon]|nr:hypothetical protein [Candidatus Nanoarchaeia archaeon]